MPLHTGHVMVVHASVASNKPKVELDLHADTFVLGDTNRPVNVYSYNLNNSHRSAKTVHAAVGYQDP